MDTNIDMQTEDIKRKDALELVQVLMCLSMDGIEDMYWDDDTVTVRYLDGARQEIGTAGYTPAQTVQKIICGIRDYCCVESNILAASESLSQLKKQATLIQVGLILATLYGSRLEWDCGYHTASVFIGDRVLPLYVSISGLNSHNMVARIFSAMEENV